MANPAPTRGRPGRRLATAALLGVLVAAGCGGGGGAAVPSATPTARATSTATALPATSTPTSVPPATATPSETATIAPTPTATATDTPEPTPTVTGIVSSEFSFSRPVDQQLSAAGAVAFTIEIPSDAISESLTITLDGQPASVQIGQPQQGLEVSGSVSGVAPGAHELRAEIDLEDSSRLATSVSFEATSLTDPNECEVLNNAECLLPYPSSRFLEPADTPTGWRVRFPQRGMPAQFGQPLSPEPYARLDGFSPTVQILMHFPGGVDPAASNASRLLAETRTHDLRSFDADSPTVLIDADASGRVIHFIEPDAHAPDTPERQTLFLRPGRSLTPGHRYIVAARNLRHADGGAVRPEPVFAALRDRRPTDIAAVESRRNSFEDIFARLEAAGVPRDDLVLAFDFVVASDQGLTGQMLSMRDQAFAWLAAQAEAGLQTFTVEEVAENDCAEPEAFVWRIVSGRYKVPLFLDSDPVADPFTPGFLAADESGVPVASGFTEPPFSIAIPCSVLSGGSAPKRFLVLGHGLFGDGRGMVEGVMSAARAGRFDYVAGATDWRGLSTPDITPFGTSFIVGNIVFNLQNFPALPDRLRQGQLHTLVLAKMMRTGAFNMDAAFRTPSGTGVIATDEDGFYFGASLGGIMGLMFAALTPDVTNLNVDVPAINFSLLLQRATPFAQFEAALPLTGLGDPMRVALALGIINELWVRGESAGYATHITGNPLPGTRSKSILMTMAWLDQQVSNQATEIAARTLGLPNLAGSLRADLPLIPDRPGPLDSALVIYDTGSLDPENPAHAPYIPPLANRQAKTTPCDPHGLRGYIPASLQQLGAFLQPGGKIENFCAGICDASEPDEIPFGENASCDPLAVQ